MPGGQTQTITMTSWQILKILTVDIFSWMALGMVLARLGFFSIQHIQFVLRKVVINMLFPCLILEKILINLNISDTLNMAMLFAGALVMFLGSCCISFLWVPRIAGNRESENTMLLCNTFQNYGFMVFPLALNLLGEKGLALALIYSLTGDALLWSLGIYLLQRMPGAKIKWKEIITPPAVTVLVSVVLALAGVPGHIPGQIFTLLHYPALLTVPLAIICSGGIFFHTLKGMGKRDFPVKEISFSLTSRMLVLPLLWIGVISMLVPQSLAKSILYIEAVMPASVVITALVAIYGGDRKYAVLFSLLTVLLSILTVPLYLSFLF
ncbi:AEC family transporter [Fibrobacterota bacterium]